MKTVRILALHLAFGGVEKAIISMANLLVERYDVEIISVYDMPNAPAYPLDQRVRLRYLLREVPNRAEWKAALRAKKPAAFFRESLKSVRILQDKKRAVRQTIRSIHDGVLITTRHEDNLVSSKYGDEAVLKIAQLHHDHRFKKHCADEMRRGYGRIDILALLTPVLLEEAREIMAENRHTRLVLLPNFLERLPENVPLEGREKTVLTVGRMAPEKGYDRLIRCFKAVHEARPDWKLRILGEGEEREKLEALRAELGLEAAVEMPGRMDSFQIEEEMKRASVFAMTALSDALGYAILEEQSCGLPIVAFDVRVGPGFVIRDGVNGFLVPDGDEAAFSQRLLELIDSPELRRRTGEAALRRAADFSREKIGRQWFALIGE